MNLCAAALSQALCEEYSDEMTSWLALTDRLSKEVSCSAVVRANALPCSLLFPLFDMFMNYLLELSWLRTYVIEL